MSTPATPDRVAAGRARLEARARRLAMIRRRVAATALAAFALAWGVIAWDGSMGAQTPGASAVSTGPAASVRPEPATTVTSDQPAPVTTAQS